MSHSPKLCINDILFKEGRGISYFCSFLIVSFSNKGKGILTVQFSRSTVVMEPRLCSSTQGRKEGRKEN